MREDRQPAPPRPAHYVPHGVHDHRDADSHRSRPAPRRAALFRSGRIDRPMNGLVVNLPVDHADWPVCPRSETQPTQPTQRDAARRGAGRAINNLSSLARWPTSSHLLSALFLSQRCTGARRGAALPEASCCSRRQQSQPRDPRLLQGLICELTAPPRRPPRLAVPPHADPLASEDPKQGYGRGGAQLAGGL